MPFDNLFCNRREPRWHRERSCHNRKISLPVATLIIVLLLGLLSQETVASIFVQDFNQTASPVLQTTTEKHANIIGLGEGWNLLSLPMWAEQITLPENDIKAWLVYRDGNWQHGNGADALRRELNNPARAVFIKTAKPTSISVVWAEITPNNQFASQNLHRGWNLIGTSIQADYLTILANVYDLGGGGVSMIYAPNEYNQRKQEGLFIAWPIKMHDLSSPSNLEQFDMSPFDGYWVNLSGSEIVFSTPVSDAF